MPNTREKLIELLKRVKQAFWVDRFNCDYYGFFADRLIANGVKIHVLCNECKYCDPENSHCDHPMATTLPVPRKPNDFCSYGERRS